LSQLAAGGITGDGWDDFNVGMSGDVLRIGTIRAPEPAAAAKGSLVGRMGQRAIEFFVTPRKCSLATDETRISPSSSGHVRLFLNLSFFGLLFDFFPFLF
jgi:hypothetical protein